MAGRLISHNILLCQDIVKHYSRKGCYSSCLIKVDLRKVYDTKDWSFLHDMLIALNFPLHFIRIIMVCINSTHYSIMLNGSPSKTIKPKRGLRQGGMEYLFHTLMRTSSHEDFKFHPRCRKLRLNHLSFTDLMFFCKGTSNLFSCSVKVSNPSLPLQVFVLSWKNPLYT